MIIYVKHIDIEGPGTLGDFLQREGFDSKTIGLGIDETIPQNFDDIEAVVSLGGPMNVYEEDKYPFLREENTFIQEILRREIPFMGLCLGSQLLAKAAGAEVGKSPVKEIGFFKVQFTEDGHNDPLFAGVEGEIDVYQWHEDMSAMPAGGQLLATSTACPHQAFKVGSCAYGLQFHVEITDKSIAEWSDAYLKKDPNFLRSKKAQMLTDYKEKKEFFDATADKIYKNFVQLVRSKQRIKT